MWSSGIDNLRRTRISTQTLFFVLSIQGLLFYQGAIFVKSMYMYRVCKVGHAN